MGRGWVAIVNPRSHGGFTPARLDRLRSTLRAVVDDVLVSQHAGHVDALVRGCHTAEGIVIGGGDGTIFEVLQSCDRPRQVLNVLPFGRGNSLARDLGVTTEAQAIEAVVTGTNRSIDLLRVTLRSAGGDEWQGVSASNLAIGYPAAVASRAAAWRWMRASSYGLAGIVVAPQWFTARIAVDDEAEHEARLTGLIISNSRYVGPFLGFATANLCDGICQTMELRASRVRQWLHNASALTGLNLYAPVSLRELQSIRVRLDRPTLVKIDGELRPNVVAIEIAVLRHGAIFRVAEQRRA